MGGCIPRHVASHILDIQAESESEDMEGLRSWFQGRLVSISELFRRYFDGEGKETLGPVG